MISLLTDIVLIVTGFQLILLSIVIFRQKLGNRLNSHLLVAFLLSKAFLITRWFLFRFEILPYPEFGYLYFISSAGFFLLAPLLFLYIQSLCYRDFALRRTDWLHGIPFLCFVLLTTFVAYLVLNRSETDLLPWESIFISNYWRLFWTANLVQILFYILAMLRTVYIYKTQLKELYSAVERINLNWLVGLLTVIFLYWIFITFRATLALLNIRVKTLINALDLFSITIFLVFTTILVFKGLNQSKIFSGINGKIKYGDLKLSNTVIEEYTQQLTHYMQTHKPYLIPSLTIEDLSEELSVPSWHLSQVINDSFHENFFNFVNRYRIEEVKQKFKDPNYRKKTILEILYETGFNSKSTFNSVFKKYTGMTPSEFKRRTRVKV